MLLLLLLLLLLLQGAMILKVAMHTVTNNFFRINSIVIHQWHTGGRCHKMHLHFYTKLDVTLLGFFFKRLHLFAEFVNSFYCRSELIKIKLFEPHNTVVIYSDNRTSGYQSIKKYHSPIRMFQYPDASISGHFYTWILNHIVIMI